jgi:DNA-binding response OmpR family regulator
MKLLIIDGDRNLVEMLNGWLRTMGFSVCRAYTAERAQREWEEQQPDLVVLESFLAGVDTLKMCRDMRAKHDALVLMLATCMDVQDEVRCLESGADAYLRKPFYPAQLLAHIHALSRRGRSGLTLRPSSVVCCGPLRVDSLHNEVSVYGKVTRLTPTESKLLHLLSINVNTVCTAGQIISYIWGFADEGDASLIKAHIHHLRQKIGAAASDEAYIQTIPSVGYSLVYRPAEEDSGGETPPRLRAITV